MKSFAVSAICLVLLTLAAPLRAQEAEMPEMPRPTSQHDWLQQLTGEWENSFTADMPDQPPMECQGTETAEMMGGFWLISKGEADIMGMKLKTVLTLGYDEQQQKFVGTWIDSMNGYMWEYEGTLDESGQKLILNTRGPCPQLGGEMADVRETIELKDKDHKVFTSSFKTEDGSWEQIVQVDSRRK